MPDPEHTSEPHYQHRYRMSSPCWQSGLLVAATSEDVAWAVQGSAGILAGGTCRPLLIVTGQHGQVQLTRVDGGPTDANEQPADIRDLLSQFSNMLNLS